MSYAVMPEVGGDMVCANCEHNDCAYWRGLIGSACAKCREPVESGDTYQFTNGNNNVIHFACAVEGGDA